MAPWLHWAQVARSSLLLGSLALALCASPAHARQRSDRDLPEKYRKSPYALMSLSVGAPNAGWQLRAKKLSSSPQLWIQEKSVPYTYGHPSLVLMLHRTAKQIARQSPGSVLLVGDLSREFGGPLSGHRSHQSGRDADVGFFVTDAKGRPQNARRLLAFDAQGRARDGSGLRFDDYRNWLLVQLWLKDHRAQLEHVFVASHLRKRLLDFARARPAFRRYVDEAAKFLRQPTNVLPHDDHFHVRIACPDRQQELCAAPRPMAKRKSPNGSGEARASGSASSGAASSGAASSGAASSGAGASKAAASGRAASESASSRVAIDEARAAP